MAVTVTFPAQLLRLISIAATLLFGLSACDDASGRPLVPVNYGAFTQTASYSIANQLGFFTVAGLNVTYLQIPNSPVGYGNLLSGVYDVLTGTIDNAVNLRFNSHKNLTVLGQLDGGPDLVIASTESIKTVADIKGKSVIVDSPVSGYAYILRKVLSTFGLELQNGDYTFQTVGSTNIRYTALTTGYTTAGAPVYATILTYPFTAFGQALTDSSTPNILARVSDFIQPLSSSAITVAEESLSNRTERITITRFLGALYAANLFLADPKHAACATNAIAKQLNIPQDLAQVEYKAATDSLTGETSSPKLTVNTQGLMNVIDVRKQFGGFASVPAGFDFGAAVEPGTGKLIDYSVRDEVARTLDHFKFNPRC